MYRWLLPLFTLIGANGWSAGPFFNVLDYGARNDGSVSATEAIRSAIQAAKAADGGTVYVPAGKYVSLVSLRALRFRPIQSTTSSVPVNWSQASVKSFTIAR